MKTALTYIFVIISSLVFGGLVGNSVGSSDRAKLATQRDTSPIEIRPIIRPSSSTGRWRNRPSVIFWNTWSLSSSFAQPTGLAVMISSTVSSRQAAPRRPNHRRIEDLLLQCELKK